MRRYEPSVACNNPCTICGSGDSTLLFETEFKRFGYNGRFFMRTCSGCGLRFASPRLTDADIASLYDESYYVFAKSDQSYFARTAEIYDRSIRVAEGLGPLEKRAIEVGSGKGYMLAALEGLGWKTKGIEISGAAGEHARTAFGIDTFVGQLEDYGRAHPEAPPYPVVLCIDIIEHVTDPDSFARGLAQITAPGGVAIIDTPNGGARHIDLEGADWRGFNPFHIYLFNAQNLGRLLERHGFRIDRAFTYNNFETRRSDSFSYARSLWQRLLPRRAGATTLDECIDACRASKGYFATADARGELAPSLAGENVVVLARKV